MPAADSSLADYIGRLATVVGPAGGVMFAQQVVAGCGQLGRAKHAPSYMACHLFRMHLPMLTIRRALPDTT